MNNQEPISTSAFLHELLTDEVMLCHATILICISGAVLSALFSSQAAAVALLLTAILVWVYRKIFPTLAEMKDMGYNTKGDEQQPNEITTSKIPD